MSERTADHIDIVFALDLLCDAWADAKPREVLLMAIAKITELRAKITELEAQLDGLIDEAAHLRNPE